MNAPLRRGACPGLSAPMQTGDGLLVRLLPIGTISLPTFSGLCAAARAHGNGIIEVTARGSIQVRGLDTASVPRFVAAVGALGVAAEDGIPVHTNPLAGLDPDEVLDAGNLAAHLRCALADNDLAAQLSPKVSVAVDGGGTLDLDRLSVDVRLRAALIGGAVVLRISVGGDAASATTELGFVAPAHAVAAAIRLLEVIAQHGRNARARGIIARDGPVSFKTAIADWLLHLDSPPCAGGVANNHQLIGAHRLRDGTFAFCLGLAFGHADATSLENLAEAAAARGATGTRAAPGRVLTVIGLASESLPTFIADAERLGFVVRADDPCRHVIACAGTPFCASGHIAARTIAPEVAKASAQFLGDSLSIHISGCAKGCAHPAAAALTVVGMPEGCGLIANGATHDVPFAIIPKEEVIAAIAEHAHELTGEDRHV
jgi:precorrin-3B synthase